MRTPWAGGRALAFALLAAAVVLGAMLRWYALGASELTPDEAASWAAAAAPNIAEVIRRQAIYNPGKLAAYELLLHGWMDVAGGSVVAMRTLSALLGIAAILIIFWAAREVLALNGEQSDGDLEYTAALSALIAAVSLITVRYTREARMYPLLMAAALAQTAFLLRARRRGGLMNYIGAAIFTAVAIAANFSAVFLFAAQALWLVASRRGRADDLGLKPLAAICVGGILLLPFFAGAIQNSVGALNKGALAWISPPRWWAPVSFFNRGTGTLPFPVLLPLALWAVATRWRRLEDSFVFALFWMFGPVLMLFAISLTVTPMLEDRYALTSYVPFFILAAAGITALRGAALQAGALVLATALSIGHTAAFVAKPPSRQWTHAVAFIQSHRQSARIAVAPPHGANVLRYYLAPASRIVPLEFTPHSCAGADLLMLWDHALEEPDGGQVAKCRAGFAHPLFSEKDVAVVGR